MTVLDKLKPRKNIFISFIAFVFCAIFIDQIKIADYYLFEVLLGLSCILTLIYVFLLRKVLIIKRYVLIPFFLLIIWSIIEMFIFKEGLKYAPKYFIYALIEIWILVNLVIQFIDKDNHDLFIKSTCWIFIGLAVILTGYYISQGVIINSNDFGQNYSKYLLGFGAIGSYYLLLSERKTTYGILSYLLLVPSILSANRKLWLALFVVYVVMTVLYLWGPKQKNIDKDERKKLFLIVILLLAALIISGIIFITSFPQVSGTVTQTFGDVKSAGDTIRKYVDIHAIDNFLRSPIIGNGWGDRIYIPELGRSNMYHNSFLSILSQLGLIGFLLYCGVFAYSIVNAFVIMFKKTQYFDYGLLILALWLYSVIVLYFRPLNRMSYYLVGPPLIFSLVFDAWEAKKYLALDLHKRIAIKD